MRIHLETERLTLREFVDADADALAALDGDPLVMRFITGGLPRTREEVVEDFLPAWFEYYRRGHDFGFWAAEVKSTGEFIGWFHLRPGKGRGPDEPELGYRLRETAWGKGYAVEGSRALIDKAFTELGISRVLAETMTVHTASRRVMEKAGMRLVRTFAADLPHPIEGDEQGVVEYAIQRGDWERGGKR